MSEEALRRCYTEKGVHVPGCYDCAHYGHHRCSCPPVRLNNRPTPLEDRVAELERLVAQLIDPVGH